MLGPASRRWLLPLLVMALGLAVRLVPWPQVFSGGDVVLRGDTDPHYHVLRAERLLAGTEGAPWRDPWLGWPDGADIPWPPLYDAVVAGAARLAPGTAGREQVAGAGAILVVLIGLLALPLTARLAWRLTGDRAAGWLAAALVAVIPAVVQFTEVGRADQHGAELLFFAATLLVFLRAVQEEGAVRRDGLLLGLLFALAFWTWLGSALILAAPAAATALGFVASPAGDLRARRAAATLAVGGAAGALLLLLSIGALGVEGALTRGTLYPLSSLHVAMAAGVGAHAALLFSASRWPALVSSGARRLCVVAAAVVLPAAATLGLLPWLREGVATGLTALAAGNPWYASVGEFEPLLFSGRMSLWADVKGTAGVLGLTLPLALLAAPPIAARLRREETRFEAAFLTLLVLAFTGLALARIRFTGYATLPLAVCDAMGLAWLAEKLTSGRSRASPLGPAVMLGGFALAVLPTLPALGDRWSPTPPEPVAALRWLATDPVRPGREGVLSPWSMGHAVQYFAGRPVVASPFGTEGGPRSMERWARFWYARDAAEAEVVLAEARVGWVVLSDPTAETLNMLGLAPPGTPAPLTISRNAQGEEQRELTLAGVQLVPLRLHQLDGRALPGVPPLDGFQLRYESPAYSARGRAPNQVKVFAWVPGARLSITGLRPGETAGASVTVTTNQGRAFVYATSARAGAAGTAELRLPYGTGLNGAVEAGVWSVSTGGASVPVEVPPAAVLEGSGGALPRPGR